MQFASSTARPVSRSMKPPLFLAGALTLFLSGCLSGVTDGQGSKDSSDNLAVSAQVSNFSGWIDEDIGSVGQAGGSTFSGTSVTVRGSGADIWGNSDGFHFFSKQFFPYFVLTARVTGLDATDPWAKAGIMIRRDNSPESPYVFLALTSANGLAFQHRDVAGGESFHSGVGGGAPVWIRLMYRGKHITGYRSDDGVNWTFVGEATNSMPDTFLRKVSLGFAVTSHNNAATTAATFDNIVLDDFLNDAPWTDQDIGNVGLAGSTTYNYARYASSWIVRGAGDDIFNNADAFHFYHAPLIGEGSITAKLTSISNTHEWAKAGIMIRENASPGSRHVYIGFTPSMVPEFLRREVEGGSTIPVAGPAGSGPWLRITRVGNVFTAYYAAEAYPWIWTQIGQVTMDLKPEILAGLAVTSHNPSVLNVASMAYVEVIE